MLPVHSHFLSMQSPDDCILFPSMHQDTHGYICLLIQGATKEDAGWYTVSAKNEAGIVSCTARLDVYSECCLISSPCIQSLNAEKNRHPNSNSCYFYVILQRQWYFGLKISYCSFSFCLQFLNINSELHQENKYPSIFQELCISKICMLISLMWASQLWLLQALTVGKSITTCFSPYSYYRVLQMTAFLTFLPVL